MPLLDGLRLSFVVCHCPADVLLRRVAKRQVALLFAPNVNWLLAGLLWEASEMGTVTGNRLLLLWTDVRVRLVVDVAGLQA